MARAGRAEGYSAGSRLSVRRPAGFALRRPFGGRARPGNHRRHLSRAPAPVDQPAPPQDRDEKGRSLVRDCDRRVRSESLRARGLDRRISYRAVGDRYPGRIFANAHSTAAFRAALSTRKETAEVRRRGALPRQSCRTYGYGADPERRSTRGKASLKRSEDRQSRRPDQQGAGAEGGRRCFHGLLAGIASVDLGQSDFHDRQDARAGWLRLDCPARRAGGENEDWRRQRSSTRRPESAQKADTAAITADVAISCLRFSLTPLSVINSFRPHAAALNDRVDSNSLDLKPLQHQRVSMTRRYRGGNVCLRIRFCS